MRAGFVAHGLATLAVAGLVVHLIITVAGLGTRARLPLNRGRVGISRPKRTRSTVGNQGIAVVGAHGAVLTSGEAAQAHELVNHHFLVWLEACINSERADLIEVALRDVVGVLGLDGA